MKPGAGPGVIGAGCGAEELAGMPRMRLPPGASMPMSRSSGATGRRVRPFAIKHQGDADRRVGPAGDHPQRRVAHRDQLRDLQEEEAQVDAAGADDRFPIGAVRHRLIPGREVVDAEERQ